MGNYNPHAPDILGEEWVPIREEVTQFSPLANLVEVGHTFSLTATRAINNARIYVKTPLPPLADRGQTLMAAIYPMGQEDQSGPVQRVIIPCNSVVISGGSVSGAPNGLEALLTASTSTGISLDCSQALCGLIMNFAVSSMPQLNGKRMLGVNLLLGVVASEDIAGLTRNTSSSSIFVATDTALNSTVNPRALFGRFANPQATLAGGVIDTFKFGEINQFWTANSPNATADRMPWTWAQLRRLDADATRLFVKVTSGTNLGTTANSLLYIYFAALEVLYCEEKRVAVGATQFGTSFSGPSFGAETVAGANLITMHDMNGGLNPTLPIGSYTVVASSADVGGLNANQAQTTSSYPDLNALRQLYEIPTHAGMQVDLPFPMNSSAVDRVFTAKHVDILPQLSLHVSGTGGPLVEPHAYGRQARAQVYGSLTATQKIQDGAAGGATTWPQVRFYARRFGETTVPLLLDSATITGSSVTVTPSEWDALPTLIDGWKEVTKRFAVPPTMGTGTNPQWRFSASGETPGNRWEILGAVAPALSGVGGNLLNQVPSADRLATATYGAPSAGSTINMGWVPGYSPVVTATTDDVSSDAALLFSTDPATITGVAISTTTQALTGFVGCDPTHGPCCLPTAIQYNQITWGLPPSTGVALDNFNRSITGWGNATSGQTWQNTAFPENTVDGARGLYTVTSGGDRQAWINVGGANQDVTVSVNINLAPTTFRQRGGAIARLTDNNNYYTAEMWYQSTGVVELWIRKRVAAVNTDIITVPTALSVSTTAIRKIRLQVIGSTIRAKLWDANVPEPSAWDVTLTDTSLTTGSNAGVFARNDVTGSPSTVFAFDDFTVNPPNFDFGYYELQRQDDITDWATIMKATNVTLTSFKDYEARIGVASRYRIRGVNALNFSGPWSATGTATITGSGVTMPACGTNKRGVLVFTTNDDQTGNSNLAYAMTWDDFPVEDFSFPESSQVDMQSYLDRDYQVAFHGTERGGEAFQRRLLLANAAIALPRLGNTRSLRDLAWADRPYVCVRDDIGDRWFATIIVPSTEVRRNRRLYNTSITVIEVTGDPAQVDP